MLLKSSFVTTLVVSLLLLASSFASLTMAGNANERAAARSKAGMTRELQQLRDENDPHPSVGGCRGFPLWYRRHVLNMVNRDGFDVVDDLPCSLASVYRWMLREVPYRMTGGSERDALTGRDQLLLSVGLFIYPDSKADELAAFIYSNGGDLDSRQMISSRMKELDLTKKICSTEAYQAFTAENRRKARYFWTMPPPLGVVGQQR